MNRHKGVSLMKYAIMMLFVVFSVITQVSIQADELILPVGGPDGTGPVLTINTPNTAFGQYMPDNCRAVHNWSTMQTTWETIPSVTPAVNLPGVVERVKGSCGVAWVTNAVEFWRWFQTLPAQLPPLPGRPPLPDRPPLPQRPVS